jgi:hypothetical protein
LVVPRIVALALVALAAGCGGAHSATPAPTLVDQSEVLTAFAAAGEHVRLQIDIRRDSFLGVIPAIFVPASWGDDPDPPFSVALYADGAGARLGSSPANENVAGENPEIVVHKNVELDISRSVARKQRDRLVSALKSL